MSCSTVRLRELRCSGVPQGCHFYCQCNGWDGLLLCLLTMGVDLMFGHAPPACNGCGSHVCNALGPPTLMFRDAPPACTYVLSCTVALIITEVPGSSPVDDCTALPVGCTVCKHVFMYHSLHTHRHFDLLITYQTHVTQGCCPLTLCSLVCPWPL